MGKPLFQSPAGEIMPGKHQSTPMTSEQTKSAAKNIKSRLKALGVELSIGHAYEALAGSLGYANWSTMKADMQKPAVVVSTGPSQAVDATAALKEKLRGAVRTASKNRKHRQLFLDVKRELYNTLREATSDLAAIQTLTGPFSTFLEKRGSEAHRSFAEVFRGYLGKQLIPQVGDTIAEVFADDTKGYIAKSLLAVELLLCDRLPSARRRSLLGDELSFDQFISCTEWIMSNERPTLDLARKHGDVVRFANGEIDAKKVSEMILSITHLINYGPRLAFDMFMSERSELIGSEMGVFRRPMEVA
jgi:hypothetical protein